MTLLSHKKIAAPYMAVIPYAVRACKEICDAAKIYYGELAALSYKYGYSWATDAQLAEMKDVSIATIERWNKQLEEAGFIQRRTKNVLCQEKGEKNNASRWIKKRKIIVNVAFSKNSCETLTPDGFDEEGDSEPLKNEGTDEPLKNEGTDEPLKNEGYKYKHKKETVSIKQQQEETSSPEQQVVVVSESSLSSDQDLSQQPKAVESGEEIIYQKSSGEVAKVTVSDLYRYFCSKPYSTDTVKEAINRFRKQKSNPSNVFSYVEAICDSIHRAVSFKNPVESVVLDYDAQRAKRRQDIEDHAKEREALAERMRGMKIYRASDVFNL